MDPHVPTWTHMDPHVGWGALRRDREEGWLQRVHVPYGDEQGRNAHPLQTGVVLVTAHRLTGHASLNPLTSLHADAQATLLHDNTLCYPNL